MGGQGPGVCAGVVAGGDLDVPQHQLRVTDRGPSLLQSSDPWTAVIMLQWLDAPDLCSVQTAALHQGVSVSRLVLSSAHSGMQRTHQQRTSVSAHHWVKALHISWLTLQHVVVRSPWKSL